MNLFVLFYSPVIYTFRSRPGMPIFFFIMYLVPIIYLFGMQQGFDIRIMLMAVLNILTVQNVYEIGYIQNDTETIKNDSNPALRLNNSEMQFYEYHKKSIYIWRFLSTLALLIMLNVSYNDVNIFVYTTGLLFMLVVFMMYNYFRGHINMVLYFVLTGLHYIVPFFLFPQNLSLALIVLLLMIFPIPRTVEFRAPKPADITTNIYFRKYIINFNMSRLQGFRVMAHVVLSLFSLFLYSIRIFPGEYVGIMLYILAFRAMIYVRYCIKNKE